MKTSQVCPQGHSLECNFCLAPTPSGWQSLLPQPTTDALLSVLRGTTRATMTTANEKNFQYRSEKQEDVFRFIAR